MSEKKSDGSGVMAGRIAVGLVQGVALYVVSQWRRDTPLFGLSQEAWAHFVEMARTVVLFAPLPVLFGLGNLPPRRLALWAGTAALVLAFVGWMAPAPVWSGAPPVVTVWLFSLIVLYIVHEFVQAAHEDRRPIASYATYFDLAWRHAYQAGLALGFTVAFWIVLWLGAWLFNLIGIRALQELLEEQWFATPALATAFALAIHWTDADSGLTRGARQIGLALLSWLAILFTVILTLFLAALPFTGLEPLWDTKRATVLLLNAAATMILLVNAAFQAGDPPRSALLRAVVRFSALPLAGVVALAALGLFLRIDQYGLTPARVLASTELLIVALYGAGYVWAAVKPGAWMEAVKSVNIVGAAFVATMLLALMTPLLDPARVAVADQVARLESGRVDPDDFDFGFLANDRSSHWGPAALAKLATKSGSARNERIATLAKNPGARDSWRANEETFNDRRAAIRLVGSGALPDAALLPPADGPDPIGQCVATWKAAVDGKALADEEARRALRLGRRPAAAKPVALDDPAPPQTPEEARCLVRLMDLDFDGDEDLLLLSSDFDPKSRALTFWVLTQDHAGWRVTGRQRDGAALPADGDWRDDHARLEPFFAGVVAVDGGRRDVIAGGSRLRWFPTRAALPREALAAAITMREGAPPPALLVDEPVRNPIIACADGSIEQGGCFGRRLDADGDGVPEFIVITFSELTPSFTIYREAGSTVSVIGEAQGVVADWRARWDEKRLTLTEFFRRERTALVDRMTTATPLVADLDAGGQRVRFDYPAQSLEPDPNLR